MRFDNLANDWFLEESVLDLPRDKLDAGVFTFPEQGPPVIKQAVKQQIIAGVGLVHSIIPVQDYFVIGSILTPKYNNYTDIDVNCEVEEHISEIGLERLVALLKNIRIIIK